jgi:hypothetical protein
MVVEKQEKLSAGMAAHRFKQPKINTTAVER